MLKVEKFNKIKNLENLWKEMQGKNLKLDAMAEYDFVNTFLSGITHKIKTLLKRSRGGRPFIAYIITMSPYWFCRLKSKMTVLNQSIH